MNTLLPALGRLIDRLPMVWVAALALWLAAAPIVPEPHLLEKLRMLSEGTLTRPLDVFDLLMHATPLGVLVAKLWRARANRGTQPPPG